MPSSISSPDRPLNVALAILVAAPGVHHACRVQSKAVPAASGDLGNLNAPQRGYAPGLLLIIPAFMTAIKAVITFSGRLFPCMLLRMRMKQRKAATAACLDLRDLDARQCSCSVFLRL